MRASALGLGRGRATTAWPSAVGATTFGSDVLAFNNPGPFNVVAQQLTVVTSPPGTIWSLAGTLGGDAAFQTGPSPWSMGLRTPFTTRRSGRWPAYAAYRLGRPAFGGLALAQYCPVARGTRVATCIDKPIPFAPGDTYEIIDGGSQYPYGPVIRDETLNYDVFTDLGEQNGFYPAMSGLYDLVAFSSSHLCRRQRAAVAVVAPPALNDYALLGPPHFGKGGSTAEPAGDAIPATGLSLDRCPTSSSFRIGPDFGLPSEAWQFRRLPHVKFAIDARFGPAATRITRIRPVHAAPPMFFEADCGGLRCPFASVRGRFGHLRRFERTIERRPYAPGDKLFLFVGTSDGCGPTCEWGQQLDIVQTRRTTVPKLILCEYLAGPSVPNESCGNGIPH